MKAAAINLDICIVFVLLYECKEERESVSSSSSG